MKLFTSLLLSLLLFTSTTLFLRADDSFTEEDCIGWAEDGECEENPGWMWRNCEEACQAQRDGPPQEGEADADGVKSFYELKAYDIGGDEVDFRQFEGKVLVITNVASYCGRTDQHYSELNQLHRDLKAKADTQVEIMAFPCNQFGNQEPEENPFIKNFAEEKGVQFRMMDKIDVNGGETSPVYEYLKKMAGPKKIRWNFDTYYVVDKQGHIESFTGITPRALFDPINALLVEKEL